MKKKLIITAAITSVLAVSGVSYAATRNNAPASFKSTPTVSKTVEAKPAAETTPTAVEAPTTQKAAPQTVTPATPAPVTPKVLFDVSSTNGTLGSDTTPIHFTTSKQWKYNLTFSNCPRGADTDLGLMAIIFVGSRVHPTSTYPYRSNTGASQGAFSNTYPALNTSYDIAIRSSPSANCTWHVTGEEL